MFQTKYAEENRLLIQASVTEEEGAALTLFTLTKDESCLSPEALSSFLERSLMIRNKKGELIISPIAEPCLSFHPLLGRAPQPKPYPSALMPFLFSLASRGALSENPSQRTRYLNSELFSSFFPGFEKDRVSKAAVKLVNAFLALGLLRAELGDLYLESSSAGDFMKLSEFMRLSHVLAPEKDRRETGKTAYALFLYAKAEADTAETRKTIKRITGIDLPDEETLSSLFIVPGAVFSGEKAEKAVISTDFSLTLRGIPDEPVYLYAEPVKHDTVDTWLITKQSVRAALSSGMTREDIMSSLGRLSATAIPDSVTGRIQSWAESFSSLRCMRAVILIADERNARILDALPMLKGEILAKPAENVFIMESSTEAVWRRTLENSGLDMLAFPSGSSTEQKAPAPSFFQTIVFPSLPDTRTVPFNPESRMPREGDSALKEAYKRSGLLLTESDTVPPPDMVSGLYYQEKQRFIKEALAEGKLYAELADGTVYIARPEKTDDPDLILLLGQEVRVSLIWKCARLPVFIEDTFRKGLDEESQDNDDR